MADRDGPLLRMSIVVWGLVAIVLALALLWLLQRRLIYLPTQVVPDIAHVIPDGEEVTFTTDDGLELAAWHVPGRGERADVAVLVLPGNAGDRSLRSVLGTSLADHGMDVLLVDYRGYGGNPGSPSERGLALDARAARAALERLSGLPAERTVYFGESLGAAVAIELAVDHTPGALVLRSPFTSLVDVGRAVYPTLPVGLLLRDRYPSEDRIRDVTAPLLVVASDADEIIPLEQSQRLYEAAGEPKQLVVFEGLDHNHPVLTDGRVLIEETVDFVRTHLDDRF